MKSAFGIIFGLFLLALSIPGLWSGWRHGRVKFRGLTYWRNEDRRSFWDSEISNIVGAILGVFFLAYGMRELMRAYS